jgi:hypothetical protein
MGPGNLWVLSVNPKDRIASPRMIIAKVEIANTASLQLHHRIATSYIRVLQSATIHALDVSTYFAHQCAPNILLDSKPTARYNIQITSFLPSLTNYHTVTIN